MNRFLMMAALLAVSSCGGGGNGIYHRLFFMIPTQVPLDAPTLVKLSDLRGQQMTPVSLTCTPGPCDVDLKEDGERGFLVTPHAEGRHVMVAIVHGPRDQTLIADEFEIEAVQVSGLTLTKEGVTPLQSPLQLIRSGDRLSVCTEARRSTGQTIDSSATTFTIDRDDVLRIEAQDYNSKCRWFLLVGHGVAKLVATFGVHSATLEVRVFDPARTRGLALQEQVLMPGATPPWKPLGEPVPQLSMTLGSTRSFQVLGIADDGQRATLKASCLGVGTGSPQLGSQADFSQFRDFGLIHLAAQVRGVAQLVPVGSCGMPAGLSLRVTVN